MTAPQRNGGGGLHSRPLRRRLLALVSRVEHERPARIEERAAAEQLYPHPRQVEASPVDPPLNDPRPTAVQAGGAVQTSSVRDG